ncbi:hypothetical protein AX17_006377 [Amanita inopinata Kibby_2008]|nr:hypothetical protein AX17_006377 [Amanita inopinata Kibby_2008]
MYDNHIALDFISSNPSNLLASGPHMLQSNFHIFSSDNNASIMRMSTPQGFHDICQDMLTKMIDTVSNGINLAEVIMPSPLKPNFQLTVSHDSTVNIKVKSVSTPPAPSTLNS